MTDEFATLLKDLANDPAFARRMAVDPMTPPPILEHLATSPDAAIRALVAANPNTPEPMLRQLATEFPQAFLANPVLPLVQLANPAYAATLDTPVVLSLLRCTPIPALLRRVARTVPAIRDAYAMHVAEAGDVGDDWLAEAFAQVRRDFHGDLHIFAPLPGLLPSWFFAAFPPDYGDGALSLSPDAPPSFLAEVTGRSSLSTQRRVARNPRTPTTTLAELARSPTVTVRLAVAQNTTASSDVLHHFVGDEPAVRRAVAYHPRTAPADLVALADDADQAVRVAVARHPRLDEATCARLATDPSAAVRAAIACHPRLPLHLLEGLAHGPEAEVRHGAARNPRLPRPLRLLLAQDSDVWVRETAWRQRPEGPDADGSIGFRFVLEDPNWDREVAHHPSLPLPIMEALASDPDQGARAALARNSRTPVALLEQLADDKAYIVWLALARNPHTPFAVLLRLMESPMPQVWHAVAHHPTVSREARQVLYEHLLAARSREMRNRLATSANLRLFYHPRAGATYLLALATARIDLDPLREGARSWHWLARFMVAMNPHAPRDVLTTLILDGNRYVRAAARQTLRQNESAEASHS